MTDSHSKRGIRKGAGQVHRQVKVRIRNKPEGRGIGRIRPLCITCVDVGVVRRHREPLINFQRDIGVYALIAGFRHVDRDCSQPGGSRLFAYVLQVDKRQGGRTPAEGRGCGCPRIASPAASAACPPLGPLRSELEAPASRPILRGSSDASAGGRAAASLNIAVASATVS